MEHKPGESNRGPEDVGANDTMPKSDEGVGATSTDESNTFEPEEVEEVDGEQ
ncbi:hypothetical protein [Arthrobacter sp. KK5.5]|uniref:hypothetical protein n=1 Tax=Arthrobacter sp. KK5.5 TaxID=3373084 RepID=UPI003EE68134